MGLSCFESIRDCTVLSGQVVDTTLDMAGLELLEVLELLVLPELLELSVIGFGRRVTDATAIRVMRKRRSTTQPFSSASIIDLPEPLRQ